MAIRVLASGVACAAALGAALLAPGGNASIEPAAKTVKIDIPMASGVAASRDGSRVWVVGADDGTINKITNGKLKQTITTGGDDRMDVWTTRKGKTAFALDGTRNKLFRAKWGSNNLRTKATSTSPVALVGGKTDGRKVLYVLNFNSGTDKPKTVSVFGRPNMKFLRMWSLPSAQNNQPLSLALSPDGSELYVGNSAGRKAAVWVLSTETGKVIRRLKAAYPEYPDIMLELDSMAVSPGGRYLFAGVSGMPGTYKLDSTTGELVARRRVRIGNYITSVASVATLGDDRVLAVATSAPSEGTPPKGKLQVLRKKNLKPTQDTIRVDRLPLSVAASQSGKRSTAHVANYVLGSYWGIPLD